MTLRADHSIGFLSTFPPTVCGIASYTASLIAAVGSRPEVRQRRLGVVRLTDAAAKIAGSPVVFHHRSGDRASLHAATEVLNTYDTVSIQHEFGIFGERDGIEVVDLMLGLRVPTALTCHTVLSDPSPRQRVIMERMAELAERMIVMSETAADRLTDRYGVDPSRINVIPHGADPDFAGPSLVTGDRPLVLTWGLIGPGKGLEWAIEALAELVDLEPRPRYLIAGATHPQVRLDSGESYRQGLISLTKRLGLEEVVEFNDRYLERDDLARLVRSADVVILPYESAEQVTSGVLVEAIAASKPVVATRFPHAVELLGGGAGAVVPFGEPSRLAAELRHILSDAFARSVMTRHAGKLARDWYWPSVGKQFTTVISEIAEPHKRAFTPKMTPQRVAG